MFDLIGFFQSFGFWSYLICIIVIILITCTSWLLLYWKCRILNRLTSIVDRVCIDVDDVQILKMML